MDWSYRTQNELNEINWKSLGHGQDKTRHLRTSPRATFSTIFWTKLLIDEFRKWCIIVLENKTATCLQSCLIPKQHLITYMLQWGRVLFYFRAELRETCDLESLLFCWIQNLVSEILPHVMHSLPHANVWIRLASLWNKDLSLPQSLLRVPFLFLDI